MERDPVRESSGKIDKTPLYLRLYFQAAYYELARVIGYAGLPMEQARDGIKPLAEKYGKEKMANIAEELVRIDGTTNPPTARLKDDVRRLCHQLLGPDPAKQPTSSGPPQNETPKPEPKPVEPQKVKPARTPKAKPKEQPKAESLPRGKEGKASPIMQQYQEAKEKFPNMVLLFRIGDFFEVFNDDAEELHKRLGLTLTTRDRQIKMCGFPAHQLEIAVALLERLLNEHQAQQRKSKTSTHTDQK